MKREEIRVAGHAEPISHYTDAVRAGDLLFVSGVVAVDSEGRLVGGGGGGPPAAARREGRRSGQGGRGGGGGAPAGGRVGAASVAAQARHVFESMRTVLGAAGCGFADVVKVTIFLTDVDDRPRINPVRQEVFGAARPASTLVEVSRLAVEGAKIEVEAIAAIPT